VIGDICLANNLPIYRGYRTQVFWKKAKRSWSV